MVQGWGWWFPQVTPTCLGVWIPALGGLPSNEAGRSTQGTGRGKLASFPRL